MIFVFVRFWFLLKNLYFNYVSLPKLLLDHFLLPTYQYYVVSLSLFQKNPQETKQRRDTKLKIKKQTQTISKKKNLKIKENGKERPQK